MFKFCAFDLDGTLVNSVSDIAAACNRSLVRMGLPAHETDEYYNFVGNGMRKICERALPEDSRSRADELVALYDEDYTARCCELSSAYDGMPELLRRLAGLGVSLAVVTNKPQSQTDRVVAHYYGDIPFIEILGASDRFPRKPAPDMLRSVIDRFGFLEGETLYVGDSGVDVEFARASQVPCAGVAWGFRGARELADAGAEFIIHTCDELAAVALEL